MAAGPRSASKYRIAALETLAALLRLVAAFGDGDRKRDSAARQCFHHGSMGAQSIRHCRDRPKA